MSLLLAFNIGASYGLSVTLENYGYEKITYFHFDLDNGDSFFHSGPNSHESASLPVYRIKQLKNTKTYVSALLVTSIPSCGYIDFKEENDIRIVISNNSCSVYYY